MRRLAGFAMLIAALAASAAASSAAGAQALSVPEVPDAIRAPAGAQLLLEAHASGAQIYRCTQEADGTLHWTLKAPDAELRDDKGALIGRHYAGPTWRHNDGSVVIGKAMAHVESPQPDSAPWLLLRAVGHEGKGVLERVTSIQRIHTRGGQPPPAAQCDAARRDAEARSAYSADYYFYADATGKP
jgi:hypothetical protein